MVVCKCKKATKLYCFVHKVPVCGECICIPEHQICVVRTYSEWVIDGDYDWPPICAVCKSAFEGTTSTTRLGCLHVIHTTCLVQHLQSFPPHTAPAGYICPTCSTSIWPPKSIKDSGSAFHAKLKEAICQCDMGRTLLANDMNYGKLGEPRFSPSPFSSDSAPSTTAHRESSNTNNKRSYISDSVSTLTATDAPSVIISDTSVPDIVEINDAVSINLQPGLVQDSHFAKSPNNAGPGATTRKGSYRGDKFSPNQSSRNDYDDESKQKYTRRGSLRKKFFRFLLPFWSSNMPTLPVTAPRKEDRDNGAAAEDETHRRRRRSSVDPRKILLFIAIMSCLATMLLLYYRLSQSSNTDEQLELEQMEQQ